LVTEIKASSDAESWRDARASSLESEENPIIPLGAETCRGGVLDPGGVTSPNAPLVSIPNSESDPVRRTAPSCFVGELGNESIA